MDIWEYEAQVMSAACYAMAGLNPDSGWAAIGSLWALAVPRKNPNNWKSSREEAKAHNQKIDEVAMLFGTHVIATKVLSEGFSRTYADSFSVFSARFAKDPDDVRRWTSELGEKAQEKIKKLSAL